MSQTSKLFNLLMDGNVHRVDEIVQKVYDTPEGASTIARLSARIWDLKKKHLDIEIKSWKSEENPKLWCYQLFRKGTEYQPKFF